MTSKIAQGNAKLGRGASGKDKLMSAARRLLRGRPRIEFSLKEFAFEAGLTSPMIRYHFSSSDQLVEAAAAPIVNKHLRDLEEILATSMPHRDRLVSLISFLISIAREDGYLIDRYVARLKQKGGSNLEIMMQSGFKMRLFFEELIRVGYFRPTDVDVLITFLWGACKTSAQTFDVHEKLEFAHQYGNSLDVTLAEQLHTILVDGLRGYAADRE